MLPIAPLMHGATQWGVMGGSFVGRKTVLVAKFDPKNVWRLVERERVNAMMITGDAMGRPLVEALQEPGAVYDLSSLAAVASTAAVFSPTVKDDFFRLFPNLIMTDAVGSSEGGANGVAFVQKGNTAMKGGGPTVRAGVDSTVLDENLEPVVPGSGVIGKLARGGNVPVGYYKDPVKSAEVFVVDKRGKRWSIPGDFATLEADGTITLAGPRLGVDQLGRREDLPRGGRGRDQVAPRLLRRGRGRRARRALGLARGRGRRAARRPRTRRSTRCRRTAAARSRATRSRASCTSSRRSSARRRGKPDYRWAKEVALARG